MPVSLTALLRDAGALPVDEKRKWGDEYIEVVLEKAHCGEWLKRLEEAFGPAQKPAGKKPTGEQERLAAPWGGLRKEQALFSRRFSEGGAVALLWPWGDGAHTTLKVARTAAQE